MKHIIVDQVLECERRQFQIKNTLRGGASRRWVWQQMSTNDGGFRSSGVLLTQQYQAIYKVECSAANLPTCILSNIFLSSLLGVLGNIELSLLHARS